MCVCVGGGGAQTILRVPTISSLSSKARVRAEVESETKARHCPLRLGLIGARSFEEDELGGSVTSGAP